MSLGIGPNHTLCSCLERQSHPQGAAATICIDVDRHQLLFSSPLAHVVLNPCAPLFPARPSFHHYINARRAANDAIALLCVCVFFSLATLRSVVQAALDAPCIAALAIDKVAIAAALIWLRFHPANYIANRSWSIATQRLYPVFSRGPQRVFLVLARGGLGKAVGSRALRLPTATLTVAFYSQAAGATLSCSLAFVLFIFLNFALVTPSYSSHAVSFLVAMSMELPLPLHATAQAALTAFMLADSYNRDVCVTPALASPMAQLVVDWLFAGMDVMATMVLPLLPPPGAFRPSTPESRCQAVLAFLQLAIGLALPVALTAIREASQYAAWVGHEREEEPVRAAGWQAAMYDSIQRWSSWTRASPLAASVASCMLAGLGWQAVVLLTVPSTSKRGWWHKSGH